MTRQYFYVILDESIHEKVRVWVSEKQRSILLRCILENVEKLFSDILMLPLLSCKALKSHRLRLLKSEPIESNK